MQEPTPIEQTPLIRRSLDRALKLKRRIQKLDVRIANETERLDRVRNFRLMSGVAFFLALVFSAVRPDLGLALPIVLAFLFIFVFLVRATRGVDQFVLGLTRLRTFQERQRLRLLGQPSGRIYEWAEERAKNSLPGDILLTGSHSLWTLIDETLTDRGADKLLSWFGRKPLPAAAILERQKEIQSLRSETWLYVRLSLEADSNELRVSTSQILSFLSEPFVQGRFKLALIFNWLVWILCAAGFVWTAQGRPEALPWLSPAIFIGVFALVSWVSLGKYPSPFLKGEGLAHHLSLLAPVFSRIEARTPRSSVLRAHFPTVDQHGPGREARALNRILSFLSIQANPLVYLILNALLPWTITATDRLEKKRRAIAQAFPNCLEELSRFEVVGSILIFDHFQSRTYPQVLAGNTNATHATFDAKGLFHPLLSRENVIANDFSFPQGKTLGLLTGSNMSGKSTFLRTMGLNQVLANMGAPVFAESLRCSPLAVETCIEVSDSLRDGFSYFYAEVRKLKSVLLASSGTEPVLFLIDEIFRGTNNRERQIGSRSVIRALAKTPGIGFVSTHDLELTALETEVPTLMNLHFRETITPDGKMHFSYHLRSGPSPTTNALFIMKAEGLPVES